MNGLKQFSKAARVALALSSVVALAACNESQSVDDARAYFPIPQATLDLMAAKGASQNSAVLIRTYKKEAEFEIWKMGGDGRYVYIKTFPMCRWSGQLGPKTREGDRQVPEGFYSIAPSQMNPNSHYYLSFNVGYPNAYDVAHNDTGGDIMVHGICSSAGCFSMTNAEIAEIYAIAREAFAGGQHEIQMQSYPFHMTAENLAKFRLDPNLPFWKELKKGSDYFDITREEPKIGVCNKHYVFDQDAAGAGQLQPTAPCPVLKDQNSEVTAAVLKREQQDDTQMAALAPSVKPVRLVYQDGGQNPVFAKTQIEDVSRPDALAAGPEEIALQDPKLTVVKVASAAQAAKFDRSSKGRRSSPGMDTTFVAEAAAPADAPHTGGDLHKKSVAARGGVSPMRSDATSSIAAAGPLSHGGRASRGLAFNSGAPLSSNVMAAPQQPAPQQVAAATPTKPFYRRWLSVVGDKIGGQGAAGQPQPLD